MRLRFLLPLCLVLAACSHKQPPSPWTGAHWGMMPSEVLGAVPNAAQENGSQLASGATAKLRLEAASVAGTVLPAEFYFLDSRLVQISFGDSQYRDNQANTKTFDSLADSLRKQYGQETAVPSQMDPAAGLAREVDWVAGDTRIILVAIPVTATTSMIAVHYRRAES